jgi:hypothetical protein
MVCVGLETLVDNTIIGILAFPTNCDYYFYLKMMGAFFIIVSFILYKADLDKFIKSDMISAMGVSSIATIFVSLIGTSLQIIQPDVFIEIFVIGMIFIVIWMIKK